MLIHLESITETNIDFIFDTNYIHHIYKREGMNDDMVLVLNDGMNRVISQKQYKGIMKALDSEMGLIYI